MEVQCIGQYLKLWTQPWISIHTLPLGGMILHLYNALTAVLDQFASFLALTVTVHLRLIFNKFHPSWSRDYLYFLTCYLCKSYEFNIGFIMILSWNIFFMLKIWKYCNFPLSCFTIFFLKYCILVKNLQIYIYIYMYMWLTSMLSVFYLWT